MGTFQESMNEYKKQLEKGTIQQAYRGLMEYMLELRTYFSNQYPDYAVSGSLYSGYMDMTYFALAPKALKERGLKIAVVFLHEGCRFEVWLSGYNRQVQAKYWELIKGSGWSKYRLVPNPKTADAILESQLVEDPDFSDLDALTQQIEGQTLAFIQEVESFLGSSIL